MLKFHSPQEFRLIRNITIGNNVFIAPNSFVNLDVPSNSLMITNKCQVKSFENPRDGYINNILDEEK